MLGHHLSEVTSWELGNLSVLSSCQMFGLDFIIYSA